jgi:hypothetical protein
MTTVPSLFYQKFAGSLVLVLVSVVVLASYLASFFIILRKVDASFVAQVFLKIIMCFFPIFESILIMPFLVIAVEPLACSANALCSRNTESFALAFLIWKLNAIALCVFFVVFFAYVLYLENVKRMLPLINPDSEVLCSTVLKSLFKLVFVLTRFIGASKSFMILFLSSSLLIFIFDFFKDKNLFLRTNSVAFWIDSVSTTLQMSALLYSCLILLFGSDTSLTHIILSLVILQGALIYLKIQMIVCISKLSILNRNEFPVNSIDFIIAQIFIMLRIVQNGSGDEKIALSIKLDNYRKNFLAIKSSTDQMKAQLAQRLVSLPKFASTFISFQESDWFDLKLYSGVEDFLLYCLDITSRNQFQFKLLYLLVLFFKRNKKTDCVLKYFQMFHQAEKSASVIQKQQAHFVRNLIENTISSDYSKNIGTINTKLDQAIEFNDLVLRTIDQVQKATSICAHLWRSVKLEAIDFESAIKINKRFVEESEKSTKLFQRLKSFGTPATSVYKVYIDFLRNVAYDFDKASFYLEMMRQSIGRKYIAITEVDLQLSKFTLNTPKTFIVVSGERGKYGQMIYLSEEVKQVLGLDDKFVSNKNIGKLKPGLVENSYKNWITNFFEDDQKYSDVTNNRQFYDVFLDSSGFIKLFLVNIRLNPVFKFGVEFFVFFTQVRIPQKSSGVIVFNKSDGHIIGFDRYLQEEFLVSPENVVMEGSFGLPNLCIGDFFPDLPDKISIETAKEGIKIITVFYPQRVIKQRRQFDDLIKPKKRDQTDESMLIDESMHAADTSINRHSLSIVHRKKTNQRQKGSITMTRDMEYIVELSIIKLFDLDDEKYAVMAIKNLTMNRQKTASNQHDQSLMLERSFARSKEKLLTYTSLSNLKSKIDEETKQSFSGCLDTIKKAVLILLIVQCITVGIALAVIHSFSATSIRGLEIIRLESIAQRYFVDSFVGVHNAYFMRNAIDRDAQRQILKQTIRVDILNYKIHENEFIRLLNDNVYGDMNRPEVMLDTPEFIQAKFIGDNFQSLNMTEGPFKYPLYASIFTANLARLINLFFVNYSPDTFQEINTNFPYMLLVLRSLLDAIVGIITPGIQSKSIILQDLIYFFLVLLVLKEAIIFLIIRIFDKRVKKIYLAFGKITKKDAIAFLKHISNFQRRFNFNERHASHHSGDSLSHQLNTEDDQQLSQEPRNTGNNQSVITLEDVSDSESESGTFLNEKTAQEKTKSKKELKANSNVAHKFAEQYLDVKGCLRLSVRFIFQTAIGILVFYYFNESYSKLSYYSAKSIDDILLIGQANQDLNLIKIYQSQKVYDILCTKCNEDLILARLDYIRTIKKLRKSLNLYTDHHFNSIRKLNDAINVNYCDAVIKPSKTLDRLTKDSLCSSPSNFTQGFEISVVQTFNVFDSIWAMPNNSTRRAEVWSMVQVMESSFSELSICISNKLATAIRDWSADSARFMVVIAVVLMVAKTFGLGIFLFGIDKRMRRATNSRNQVLKLLKAPMLANNQEISNICGFKANEPIK